MPLPNLLFITAAILVSIVDEVNLEVAAFVSFLFNFSNLASLSDTIFVSISTCFVTFSTNSSNALLSEMHRKEEKKGEMRRREKRGEEKRRRKEEKRVEKRKCC